MKTDFPSLTNHFLIAMPHMSDPNFSRSVVYVCEHSGSGALGLVINKSSDVSVSTLFEKIDLSLEIAPWSQQAVLLGGPVQNDHGFVLHTPQDNWSSSLKVNERVALTTSKDILEAVANGCGPDKWLLALGYAGWSAGQLDEEIALNGWLTVPADEQIMFETPLEQRFDAAFSLLGIDPWSLSSEAGRA